MSEHKTLAYYKETFERVRGGFIPAELALEAVYAAERELARASGEYTVAQATALSGRSRSWFTRRLPQMQEQGLARCAGRTWLIQAAAMRTPRVSTPTLAPTKSPAGCSPISCRELAMTSSLNGQSDHLREAEHYGRRARRLKWAVYVGVVVMAVWGFLMLMSLPLREFIRNP